MGAEYLSYVKSIKTHAHAFLLLNISAVGSVRRDLNRDTMLVLSIFWDNPSFQSKFRSIDSKQKFVKTTSALTPGSLFLKLPNFVGFH